MKNRWLGELVGLVWESGYAEGLAVGRAEGRVCFVPPEEVVRVDGRHARFWTVGSYARMAAYESGGEDPLGGAFGVICSRCGLPVDPRLEGTSVLAHGRCGRSGAV